MLVLKSVVAVDGVEGFAEVVGRGPGAQRLGDGPPSGARHPRLTRLPSAGRCLLAIPRQERTAMIADGLICPRRSIASPQR